MDNFDRIGMVEFVVRKIGVFVAVNIMVGRLGDGEVESLDIGGTGVRGK